MQFNNPNVSDNTTPEVVRELLDEFVSEARPSYIIPEKAFSSYRVKRGLREADGTGVTAGVTRIGNAHGYIMNEGEKCAVDGKLEYRG